MKELKDFIEANETIFLAGESPILNLFNCRNFVILMIILY